MSNINDDDVLSVLKTLHSALAKEFLARVRSGEATASDLAAAAKFLKDNQIDADPSRNADLKHLNDALKFPFGTDEDTQDDLGRFN